MAHTIAALATGEAYDRLGPRVGSAEELTAALTWAQTESGPHLVQASL